jgi:hypothetical protein
LPDRLTVDELDIRGCTFSALPDDLVVRRRLEIGGLSLRAIPPGCSGAQLYWYGQPIDEQVAIAPETLDVERALRLVKQRCG